MFCINHDINPRIAQFVLCEERCPIENKYFNQIRGEIRKGENKKRERSEFNGPHYVECYLVKNGVCVARDKIPVNIYGGTVDGLEAF